MKTLEIKSIYGTIAKMGSEIIISWMMKEEDIILSRRPSLKDIKAVKNGKYMKYPIDLQLVFADIHL